MTVHWRVLSTRRAGKRAAAAALAVAWALGVWAR